MSKRTIAIYYGLSIPLGIIAAISFVWAFWNYQNQIAFGADASLYQVVMIGASIFAIAAGVFGMIAWIGALINLSRAQAWAWFVLMFFFGGIVLLIYLIGGPQPLRAGQFPPSQQ